MEKLFLFSPTELQMILCGDQSPQWTRDDIVNYTEPKLGYTRERSVIVLMFCQYLVDVYCAPNDDDDDDGDELVHALISSRVDYCNTATSLFDLT